MGLWTGKARPNHEAPHGSGGLYRRVQNTIIIPGSLLVGLKIEGNRCYSLVTSLGYGRGNLKYGILGRPFFQAKHLVFYYGITDPNRPSRNEGTN